MRWLIIGLMLAGCASVNQQEENYCETYQDYGVDAPESCE